VQSLNESTAEL